jgi:hypothetical protein
MNLLMKKLESILTDYKSFSYSIFKELEKLPFGSLPKKELELVILHSLIIALEKKDPYGNLHKHFSFLMRVLKLSQSQLRNKVLDAQLRFDSCTEDDVINNLINNLQNGNVEIDDKHIVFSIFNPLLFEMTKSYFEERNIIADTSFSKTIFKINLNGFIYFLFSLNLGNLTIQNKINQIIEKLVEDNLIEKNQNKSLKNRDKIEFSLSVGSSLISIVSSFVQLF